MKIPADEEPRASKRPDRTRLLGIALLVAAVPFWVAALALGRGVIRRYRRFLDPRDWFGKARR
jgi:hypothetical protein